MTDELKNIELRVVVRTEMNDDELDSYCDGVAEEIQDHLLSDEKVLTTLHTDKISYESRQLLKQLGVE